MKDPADLRREFWSLPDDAVVDRETVAEAVGRALALIDPDCEFTSDESTAK